jgi:hypothetical protein
MKDLDARLSDYHRSLLAEFAREPLPAANRAPSQLRLSRRVFGLGIATVLAVTVSLLALGISHDNSTVPMKVHLPGLTITAVAGSHVSPQMNSQQAKAAALTYLDMLGNPSFAEYSVTTSAFEPDVINVVGQCGNIYLPSAGNYWVIEASAPAQQGWQFIRATVLVNDDTGVASGAEILTGKTPSVPGPDGPPASCH